jgi:hypothetical protein
VKSTAEDVPSVAEAVGEVEGAVVEPIVREIWRSRGTATRTP